MNFWNFYVNNLTTFLLENKYEVLFHSLSLCLKLIDRLIPCSSVEISSSLAKKQMETVGDVQSHLSKFKVECRDAAEPSGWGMLF